MMNSSDSAGSVFRAPTAWIPIALAAAATAVLLGYLATGPHEPTLVVENGIARQDESPTARVWQVLMLVQLASILWFAATWLPKDARRALPMLAVQGAAFIAAALPVFLLES